MVLFLLISSEICARHQPSFRYHRR